MITYERLKQKPRAFRSITGMSIIEFDELYQKLIPVWARSERKEILSNVVDHTSVAA